MNTEINVVPESHGVKLKLNERAAGMLLDRDAALVVALQILAIVRGRKYPVFPEYWTEIKQ